MTNLYVFFLREDCEGGLDVLVEEEVERGLPELVDALGVQAGVDPDHDVRLLHTLPVDVPAQVRKIIKNFQLSRPRGFSKSSGSV